MNTVKPPYFPKVHPKLFDGEPISMMQLTNETCRWPIGEPPATVMYCGNPQADLACGVPYCSQHMRIAFQPRTRQ